MHFGVKNHFSGIRKFLKICWSDLVGAFDFLEAVDKDQLLILTRNDFKKPLERKIKIYFILNIYQAKPPTQHETRLNSIEVSFLGEFS